MPILGRMNDRANRSAITIGRIKTTKISDRTRHTHTMTQSSTNLESTWGKFADARSAKTTKQKLEEAGIESDKIVLESENFVEPIRIEETEAIANLKTGGIAGAVLGALIGLSISLIMTDFASVGLEALTNFQAIHYFSPIMGAIVGAVGMSLILGIGGGNAPQDDTQQRTESIGHLVVVKGTAEEVALSRKIIAQQGGKVEEADRR